MSFIKSITQIIVDGYGAGEVDFRAQLTQLDPQVALDVQNLIVQPIVDAEGSDNKGVVLEVQGHSDRDDTDGLSREQHRQKELQASIDRANNALDSLLQIVTFQFPGVFPPDWAFCNHVAVMPVSCGGADLIESSASLSDLQRRLNRRVKLTIVTYEHQP